MLGLFAAAHMMFTMLSSCVHAMCYTPGGQFSSLAKAFSYSSPAPSMIPWFVVATAGLLLVLERRRSSRIDAFLNSYLVALATPLAILLGVTFVLWFTDLSHAAILFIDAPLQPHHFAVLLIVCALGLGLSSLIAYLRSRKIGRLCVFACVPAAAALITPFILPAKLLEDDFGFALPVAYPRAGWVVVALGVWVLGTALLCWAGHRLLPGKRSWRIGLTLGSIGAWYLFSVTGTTLFSEFGCLCHADYWQPYYVLVASISAAYAALGLALIVGYVLAFRSKRRRSPPTGDPLDNAIPAR